jgi:hypothetical protein
MDRIGAKQAVNAASDRLYKLNIMVKFISLTKSAVVQDKLRGYFNTLTLSPISHNILNKVVSS